MIRSIKFRHMKIKSELADIKNRISRKNDPDIKEHIECDDDVVINLYTERGYLIINIPVEGDPFEDKYQELAKQIMIVFGGVVLPNPDTSSLRVSYEIEKFQ